MLRSFFAAILTSTLLLSADLITPTPAHAAALTESQIQAIVSLLSSFGADSGVIANVNATLHGQTSTAVAAAPACLSLTYNLYAGMTDAAAGGQVSQLQRFLGVNATGYFGPATQQAVQDWQSSRNIVSSGSPDTTSYGFVGPGTRAAMGCQTTATMTTAPADTTASAVMSPATTIAIPTLNMAPTTAITTSSVTTATAATPTVSTATITATPTSITNTSTTQSTAITNTATTVQNTH